VLCLVAIIASACAPVPVPLPAEPVLVEPPVAVVAPPCERIPRIEVHKSARELVAHCERGAVVRLPAAMSQFPLGHKSERHDQRTPEGAYRVIDPPRKSGRFHIFIPIDYPSDRDAWLALQSGKITKPTHDRIVAASERGVLPPQDTILGGAIGLHGEGSEFTGVSKTDDWTLGCVAVSDEDIEFLAERVFVGTLVDIVP